MNIEKPETAQLPDTGKAPQLPTRTTRNRSLTLADARAVAALCAKRATEREACAHLGIPYSTWAHYKGKHRRAEEFAEIVDAIKAAKIEAHLSNIESFSAKDWRASECYLEKTIPDRFSSKAQAIVESHHQTAVLISEESALKMIERIYSAKALLLSPKKEIQDAEIVAAQPEQ